MGDRDAVPRARSLSLMEHPSLGEDFQDRTQEKERERNRVRRRWRGKGRAGWKSGHCSELKGSLDKVDSDRMGRGEGCIMSFQLPPWDQ